MTTAILTPAPMHAPRPVPWKGMAWVAWRRYRAALTATATLLALVALYVVIRGLQMRSAYAAVQACTPHSAASCRFAFQQFHNTYGDAGFLGGMLIFVPGLIGAFAGAPLLGRELETGTFRYAWTQGAGRLRWLLALLVPGVLGVAVVTAALGALITWYNQPLVQSGIQHRLHPSTFPVTGLAIVGWGLLAYAAGVLAGLVTRRVVPALVATLAVWTGFAYTASTLRNHYLSPLTTSSLQLAQQDLPTQQWWTHHGVRASDTQINHVLQAIGVQSDGGGGFQAGPGSSSVDPVQYLLQHGYTQWTSYQPDSRYWTFQAIEFGWLTVLAVALLAAVLWLVRRRGA